jgi:hypothetical protein
VKEWQEIKNIISCFCQATCIEGSGTKSCFLSNGIIDAEMTQILDLFPFRAYSLENGFKSLGFMLKLTCYKVRIGNGLLKKLRIELIYGATNG